MCLAISALVLFNSTAAPAADYREAVGYRRLQQALGPLMPAGAGVHLALVEAPLQDKPGLWRRASAGTWWPDTTDAEFRSTRFHFASPRDTGSHSGHATAVGQLFFGNESSMAPEAVAVDLLSATEWTESVLRSGSRFFPAQMNARVINHSWVGSTGSPLYDAELLRRLDWSIGVDHSIHVVGTADAESPTPLLGNAFNVISVGRTDHQAVTETGSLDGVYRQGRTTPIIVAPLPTVSAATPAVAAAAALLVQTAERWHNFSRGVVHILDGRLIRDGARPEVIKAILMAGADRHFQTTEGGSGYREGPTSRSNNGLDRRYGAGQLNVLQSYAILSGGEQRSAEDGSLAGGAIKPYGYDFDEEFGGGAGSNEVANYYFGASPKQRWLTATLAWNVRIAADTEVLFDRDAILYDFDLELYDDTDARRVTVSASWADNTESLWLPLEPGHHYRLAVRPGNNDRAFTWRYALAWRIDSGFANAAVH